MLVTKEHYKEAWNTCKGDWTKTANSCLIAVATKETLKQEGIPFTRLNYVKGDTVAIITADSQYAILAEVGPEAKDLANLFDIAVNFSRDNSKENQLIADEMLNLALPVEVDLDLKAFKKTKKLALA